LTKLALLWLKFVEKERKLKTSDVFEKHQLNFSILLPGIKGII